MIESGSIFIKQLTANELGLTRGHQRGGVLVPKNKLKIFPFLDPQKINPESQISLKLSDGNEIRCRYIFYSQLTRNEYRITSIPPKYLKNLKPGDKIILVKMRSDTYLASFAPKGVKGGVIIIGRADTTSNKLQQLFNEGFKRETLVSRRERNAKLVKLAKQKYGTTCTICGFNFGNRYGFLGSGFIEVHHLKSIAKLKTEEKTKIDDVIVVCSNCHRMLHRGKEILPPEVLKELILSYQGIAK